MRILFSFLICLALASCTENEQPSAPEPSSTEQVPETGPPISAGIYQQLSADDFKQRLSEARNPQIIDVRTDEEYNTAHIPGAIQIDYTKPDFRETVRALDKDRPVYVYCLKGGRSQGACSQMLGEGFTEVYELKGGFEKWRGSMVTDN